MIKREKSTRWRVLKSRNPLGRSYKDKDGRCEFFGFRNFKIVVNVWTGLASRQVGEVEYGSEGRRKGLGVYDAW